MSRNKAVGLLFAVALSAIHHTTLADDSFRGQLAASATEAFSRGDFDSASRCWDQELARATTSRQRIPALAGRAATLRVLGHYDQAIKNLGEAISLAEGDEKALANLRQQLGVTLTLANRLFPAVDAEGPMGESAEANLIEAQRLAQTAGEDGLAAAIENDFGNLYAAAAMDGQALEHYLQAAKLAEKMNLPALQAAALANAAASAARSEEFVSAASFDLQSLAILPPKDSRERCMVLLQITQTDKRLAGQLSADRDKLIARAYVACHAAEQVSHRLGDARTESFAVGYGAELYESNGRTEESLQLARRAAFLAQQASSKDALYRWQWAIGRLLAARGETDAAIASYRRAVDTLQGIRADLALGGGNRPGGGNFRQSVGNLYYELADVLLRRADTATADEAQVQAYLNEARETVELLKGAELEDYFKDHCVNVAKARQKKIESIGKKTAVVYLIPLQNRTELLIGLATGTKRVSVSAGRTELDLKVRDLRRLLVFRTNNRYRAPAEELYHLLIDPIDPLLQAEHVDTLVFVPDGALRSIPMAALWDGKQFLIEKYAIAVSPGLELMEPHPLTRISGRVFVGGVSRPVEKEFSALPHVPAELRSVSAALGSNSPPMLDEMFKKQQVQAAIESEPFSVVHIASHGSFGDSARQTFVLTYDGRMSIDDLRQMMQPSMFKGQPVELLTLSACQTAVGSDRAALGLAGVAVKAGARSALATLWYVDDESSANVVSDFYEELHKDPSLSKAKALQRAQIKQIHSGSDRPYYWAPFLLIGNWL